MLLYKTDLGFAHFSVKLPTFCHSSLSRNFFGKPPFFIRFKRDSRSPFCEDTATRLLTLQIEGGVNTSVKNNYEKYDEMIDNCELFLRSSHCSYDVILGPVVQVEAETDVSNSFFTMQFSIYYDRQY